MVQSQRKLERIPIAINAQCQIGVCCDGQFQHFAGRYDAQVLQELDLLLDRQIAFEDICKRLIITIFLLKETIIKFLPNSHLRNDATFRLSIFWASCLRPIKWNASKGSLRTLVSDGVTGRSMVCTLIGRWADGLDRNWVINSNGDGPKEHLQVDRYIISVNKYVYHYFPPSAGRPSADWDR